MPDVHASITEQPRELVETIADAMEKRAASFKQKSMLSGYLSQIDFPDHARVLEIGCGSGPISEFLSKWPKVAEVVGIDPSEVLIAKAQELRGHIQNLFFRIEDGRKLSFQNDCFDVVIIHTVLCHIPEPQRALSEAYRVLKPGGVLAVFDGDYATITVSKSPHDPLGACIESFKESFINDLWIARRLSALATSTGFKVTHFDSHGYIETADPGYMLTVVDRGADKLVSSEVIDEDLASSLKKEARRRVKTGEFFGHIAYVSLIAKKP